MTYQKKKPDIKEKVPITHRGYLVSGFVLSGWLFFFPGWIKLPAETVKKWDAIKIADKDLKRVYTGLELARKIKKLIKRLI